MTSQCPTKRGRSAVVKQHLHVKPERSSHKTLLGMAQSSTQRNQRQRGDGKAGALLKLRPRSSPLPRSRSAIYLPTPGASGFK